MSQFNLFKDLPIKEDPFVDGVVSAADTLIKSIQLQLRNIM